MSTWQEDSVKLLLTYGLSKCEAVAIARSSEAAFQQYCWRTLRLAELQRYERESSAEKKKRAAIWQWKVIPDNPSELTKAEAREAIDRNDRDFLIQLGKALKEKPATLDKLRLSLVSFWTLKLPAPMYWSPLCLWTDQAITDFAEAVIGVKSTRDQIIKVRYRDYKLIKAKRPLVRNLVRHGDKIGIGLTTHLAQ